MLARTPRPPSILSRLASAARYVMQANQPGDPWSIGTSSNGLEAGRSTRRLSGWNPSRTHVNTLVASSGRTVVARSRFLVRNNPYGQAATECFTANLVGAGITPSWTLSDQDLKTKIQAAWLRWTDEADSEGITDLYGLQRRIARELFIAGECFVRRRPRFARDGLSVPLQIQVIPSEQLPIERNLFLDNGNRVRQGIEFDRIGRRVAYHFWKVHPGDITESSEFGKITIVPASDILHVYDPLEAGQIRGLPRLTPSIVAMWMLDNYDDAEMERKRVTALFTAFVKRNDPDGTMFDEAAEDAAKSGDGIAEISLEPGTLQTLLPGEDIVTAAPADVGQSYDPFQYRMLTRICAPLGLPYAAVTGDMVKANYSNQRAALLEMRRRMEALQFGVMVHQLCRPLIGWFMDSAVLAGALDLKGYALDPSPYQVVTHIPPKWDWVDPLKDAQAEVISVNNGFKARSSVIEAQGNDPIEVDNRIAADRAREKVLGLVFAGTPAALAEIDSAPHEDATDATAAAA
jgi:lambda family phage portal protein